MEVIKRAVRDAARPFGVSVMKHPTSPFRAVPVFDLSAQYLMNTRGANLSFVQIGANDGKMGDPLRKYILEFPWRGILVEPQPDVFAKLRSNYANVQDRLIFENIAIASGTNEIPMYRAGSAHASNAYDLSVSSMDAGVTARQLRIKKNELERIMVPCSTLDKLIEKHGLTAIDVLQIDVEGQDFKVLKTLDLTKHTPLIIQFEHGHLRFHEVDEAVQHLAKHGYRVLYGGSQVDTVALHSSFPLQDA